MKIAVEGKISDLSPTERTLLLERRPDDEPELADRVRKILDEVRRNGDAALFDMARQFDGAELDDLEVAPSLWAQALEDLDPEIRAGLERAARNIAEFHRAQIPETLELEIEPGVRLGRKAVPLRSVGVYAPGGRASYPSSVLMGVVPARTAGVEEVVVCSPPGPSGLPPQEVLAAAAIAGASRLFSVGGAGAIGALAYGTASIPKVDVIVGPGNRYVTEAKRQVAGEIPIDSPAGPSEVLVLAEGPADPGLVARELIAQAEHDPDAAVAVVSTSPELLADTRQALRTQMDRAPRKEIAEAALAKNGALLLADSRSEALAFVEAYAAEHLSIMTPDPRADLESITTAGTVFLGEPSSVAFGDYLTGANHVLPTAGLARSFSGLSTLDFLRFYTYQELTAAAASEMSATVAALARSEGLPGHADAALARGSAAKGKEA